MRICNTGLQRLQGFMVSLRGSRVSLKSPLWASTVPLWASTSRLWTSTSPWWASTYLWWAFITQGWLFLTIGGEELEPVWSASRREEHLWFCVWNISWSMFCSEFRVGSKLYRRQTQIFLRRFAACFHIEFWKKLAVSLLFLFNQTQGNYQ